jgi:hypothetical protein
MDQKNLTQRTVKAIRAAQTPDDRDDAKFEFMFQNSVVKTVTAQVMAHLVKQQVIASSDTLHQFPSLYVALQDIVCEALLKSSFDLVAFIEVQNALENWKRDHAAPSREQTERLSAAEIMFLAQLRAEAEDAEIIPPSYEASEMEDDDASDGGDE